MEIKSVGMLLFDDVELLDFAGPLEVFGAANYLKGGDLFSIETVGLQKEIAVSKSILQVTADTVLDRQQYDLFLIPGGYGTRPIIKNESILKRIKPSIDYSTVTATICTGALILAKLGYLKNKEVCSHHLSFDLLKKIDPSVDVIPDKRYVDHNSILTSAGVSAGIDMSFYILKKVYGDDFSQEVRKYIEYFPEGN
jgi:transcriptional regulator GlxA family with amidase domain